MTTSTNTTAKQGKQAPTNMKIKVNANHDIVITIPGKHLRMSSMVEADLSTFETTSNGNYLCASTHGWEKMLAEEFRHLAFTVSMTGKKKLVDEEKNRIETLANQAKVAKEALAEMKSDAPAMDMQEYQEFLEFKKWKAMMNAAQK
ncbi:hypothetical protein ACPA0F_18320 [Solibacillus silvestris]